MKKYIYGTQDGNVEFTIPDYVPEQKIKYECDCAYSAWSDTCKEDSSYIDMPEYIARCLADAGVPVIMFALEEELI